MAIDITVYPGLSPRVVVVDYPQTEATVQDIVDAIRAWEDSAEGIPFPPLIDAAGKESLGGGVIVGITATLQNAQIRFAARPSPLSTGTVTTANSAGKVLIDSSGDFVNEGVYVGCTVKNMTTTAMETVISVDSPQQLTSFALQAGSRQDWQVGDSYYVYPNDLCLITGGNLVAVDSIGDEMSPVLQAPNINVVRSSSSSATLQDLDAIQYASYQNAVWFDATTSNIGTVYPVGTREFPVNNLTDAIAIANTKGFSIIQLLTGVDIDGLDITNFELIGKSHVNTDVVLQDSTLCANVTIKNCNITGVLDGGTHIINCMVGDLNYVNGHIHDSGLYGTIVLGGNDEAVLANCYTVDQDNPVTVDMGGSGQDLAAPNYAGLMTITNLSDASNEIGVGLNAGAIVLDSTLSAGTIIVSGVGNVTDNTTGTANVDTTGLLNSTNIAVAVWDESTTTPRVASSMGAAFVRMVGLVHENAFIDNTTHDVLGQLTDARVRIFDTKTNADAATDGGSEDTGLIASYTVEAEFDGENLQSYRMTLDP